MFLSFTLNQFMFAAQLVCDFLRSKPGEQAAEGAS